MWRGGTLKNNNASLKQQLNNLQDAFQAGNMGHQSQPTQVFSNKEIVERSVAPQSVSSYRDKALRNQNTLQARAVSNAKNVAVCNSAPQGVVVSNVDPASEVIPETGSSAPADGDYVLVTRKKRRDISMATPPVNPKHGEKQRTLTPSHNAKSAVSKRHKTTKIGVRNSSSLHIIAGRVKTKALFVSRFSPDVTSTDRENFLKEQLLLKSLVCTWLKTKFSIYATFLVSVTEKNFPLINNVGVWPDGCLIAPFCGRLNPEQIFTSVNPVSCDPSVQYVVSDKAVGKGDLYGSFLLS
jgi:hypothetical protein